MNYNKLLDQALGELLEYREKNNKPLYIPDNHEIFLKGYPNLDKPYKHQILMHLKKEDYVDEYDPNSYYINIKGIFFIKDNGYTGRARRKCINKYVIPLIIFIAGALFTFFMDVGKSYIELKVLPQSTEVQQTTTKGLGEAK